MTTANINFYDEFLQFLSIYDIEDKIKQCFNSEEIYLEKLNHLKNYKFNNLEPSKFIKEIFNFKSPKVNKKLWDYINNDWLFYLDEIHSHSILEYET